MTRDCRCRLGARLRARSL